MILVAHRRNTRAELAETPRRYGVEVDIRSVGERLHIHHDPFVEGEDFAEWLEAYEHRLLILNVKEEGLEGRLLALMAERGVEDFFFLDQSFPFLVKTARAGERRCAVRLSEYESVETVMALRGLVEWVWVDCFTRLPLDGETATRLQDADFRLCLVSPELQGRDPEAGIEAMRAQLDAEDIRVDAVCTKRPELWR